MQFTTPVDMPPQHLLLQPASHAVCIGSCFAAHMGERLAESLPAGHVVVNPTGTLYNPVSLLRTLQWLMQPACGVDEARLFRAADGQWRHWDCASLLSAPTPEGLEALLHERWTEAHRVLLQADVVALTLSTDHVFTLVADGAEGVPVANCHKEPQSRFAERVLTIDEMLTPWRTALLTLRSLVPAVRVVMTLSPYRYAKHGMHGNALSKAQLLLLIDALTHAVDGVDYFPAYEIVLDELRDYRFYAPDMLHPSEQAVDYVWERFKNWCFSADLLRYAAERVALMRAEAHRPLHPGSEAHRRFAEALAQRQTAFRARWAAATGEPPPTT